MRKLLLLFLLSAITRFCSAQDADFYNLYFEGNALSVKGEYDKAIEKYNEAIKIFQGPYVYYQRGNAFCNKKEYQKALDDFNETLKLNKDYAEAYCQRGVVKYALGDNTCCEDLKKAVKMDLESAKPILKKICR